MPKVHSSSRHKKAYREDNTREDVAFKRIAMWKVTKDHPWRIYFKYSHSKTEPYKYLEVRKTPNTRLMKPSDLKQYNTDVQIKKAKYDDLQKAAKYLKPANKWFYQNLKHDGVDDSDDSSGEEDNVDYDEVRPFRFDDSWLTPQQLYVQTLSGGSVWYVSTF